MQKYRRADYTPLRKTVYGIGLHWTTATMPRKGARLQFEEAVERFDVDLLVSQAVAAGAGHVMFTLTHGKHHLPCPNPEVDRILPGRTCRRDLVMEIADGLCAAGIKLLLYYNHGVYNQPPDKTQDPEWQAAAGSRDPDRSRYYENYCRVLASIGRRYGPKVIAFWLDSGYEHIKYADTPWERFTMAAKEGFAERLVTYNSGVANMQAYTDFQDFWAGELSGLDFRPNGRRTPSGLPWYAFCAWHPYQWLIEKKNQGNRWPEIDPLEAVALAKAFCDCGGAVTFNLLCFQDGSILESDMRAIEGVRRGMQASQLR